MLGLLASLVMTAGRVVVAVAPPVIETAIVVGKAIDIVSEPIVEVVDSTVDVLTGDA